MNINDIITPEFEDKVVLSFLQLHAEIAEEKTIRDACLTLIPYCTPPGDEE